MTGYGETCSEISLNSIVEENECKQAAEYLGRTYQGHDENSDYPTGCYAHGIYNVYLNKHELGTGNAKAKSICKQGNTNQFS